MRERNNPSAKITDICAKYKLTPVPGRRGFYFMPPDRNFAVDLTASGESEHAVISNIIKQLSGEIHSLYQQPVLLSVTLPSVVIRVDKVGTNSLIGALAQYLRERDCLQHLGQIESPEIMFKVKNVHPDVDLYEELNLVRRMLKVDERIIKLIIEK